MLTTGGVGLPVGQGGRLHEGVLAPQQGVDDPGAPSGVAHGASPSVVGARPRSPATGGLPGRLWGGSPWRGGGGMGGGGRGLPEGGVGRLGSWGRVPGVSGVAPARVVGAWDEAGCTSPTAGARPGRAECEAQDRVRQLPAPAPEAPLGPGAVIEGCTDAGAGMEMPTRFRARARGRWTPSGRAPARARLPDTRQPAAVAAKATVTLRPATRGQPTGEEAGVRPRAG